MNDDPGQDAEAFRLRLDVRASSPREPEHFGRDFRNSEECARCSSSEHRGVHSRVNTIEEARGRLGLGMQPPSLRRSLGGCLQTAAERSPGRSRAPSPACPRDMGQHLTWQRTGQMDVGSREISLGARALWSENERGRYRGADCAKNRLLAASDDDRHCHGNYNGAGDGSGQRQRGGPWARLRRAGTLMGG